MLNRWTRKLLKVLLALLVLLFLFLLFERVRGQISLVRYKRELAARGEKLTPQDLRVSAPESDNGAPTFHQATTEIKKGLVLPDHYPPRMRVLPSGRAVVGYRELEWVEEETTNRWQQAELDLQTNTIVFARIRRALEMPAFNNNLDYAQGVDLLLPHLASARTLCLWFGADSQLAIRQRRNEDAKTSLVIQAQLPRILARDRLVISELVRIAVATIAKSSLWEALQSDILTDGDLLVIQKAWAAETFADGMANSLEGDRIYSDVSYDLLRKSNEKTAYVLYGIERWIPTEDSERPLWVRKVRAIPYGEAVADFIKKEVYCRIWRFAWSHQAQCRNMRELQGLIEIMRVGVINKSFANLRIEVEKLEAEFERKSFYDCLWFPPQTRSSPFQRRSRKPCR